MKPDMHLWWSYGIDWVKDWTAGGLPKALTFEVNQLSDLERERERERERGDGYVEGDIQLLRHWNVT